MPRPKPAVSIDFHDPDKPWADRGACRSSKLTELFYSEEPEEIAAAKQVCFRCVIRSECLEQALAFREPEGVWGGLEPKERNRLLRYRAAG